eukprot:2010176-Amphidinium_carterae.2
MSISHRVLATNGNDKRPNTSDMTHPLAKSHINKSHHHSPRSTCEHERQVKYPNERMPSDTIQDTTHTHRQACIMAIPSVKSTQAHAPVYS